METTKDGGATAGGEKHARPGCDNHGGLFRKQAGRRQIVINPVGRRTPREPVTEAQRAALARRRRLERHMEETELAQVTAEVWDESS
ncbi:hypothetical protein [uncultured Thiohalocapsa sp.]|uniref:hypothetical protein n=1 Tax=uncultured Thiohalocapsa sp. TaxID=768990 RepID=UPI0025F7B82B|nr:hypothetical protein [uncultured Thiohalocapsa sp.]